jgi:hypothetical protein
MTAYLLAANLLAALVILRRVKRSHNHLVEHLDRIANHLEREIQMSQQDIIDIITAELGKVYNEVTAQADGLNAVIADLRAQIAAGTPTAELNLSALEAAAQKLDDIVPDEIPAPPVDVTPADVVPPVDVPVTDA